MHQIIEALQFSFFQRALAMGLVLAVVFALLGNFVVLRKESVVGHSIANILFLGIALGTFLQWNISLTATLVAMAGMALITLLQRMSVYSHDSILSFVEQMTMAGAIIILSVTPGYQNIEGFLFGNILAISNQDLWVGSVMACVTILLFFMFKKKLIQMVISPDLARSRGMNIEAVEFIFRFMLIISIAFAIKIVGVILIGAFLVIPTNAVKSIATSFAHMMLGSVLVAISGVILGLFTSYLLNIPSGASIIGALGIILMVLNFGPRVNRMHKKIS
ncbi:metal ABC transporter permease [Candidatus Peregrinibacteria bacterium]|nr:MAG: metal ABC transporter permease [Candidatus Peregrinibacteria bacterium]